MIENLKIFQKTYDLLLWIYPTLQKFPRSEKFTLRQKIENAILDIVENTIIAHYSKSKEENLKAINVELEKLRIFFRLSKDLEFLSFEKYEKISRDINELGKMVGGWLKNCDSVVGNI